MSNPILAIGARSSLYESGLGAGHYLGGRPRPRAPPGGVPRNEVASSRLPGEPGEKPKNGKRPIPTSTAKPGNREGNQRIPYARFLFAWQEPLARVKELQTGDVIFVHRGSQGMGHGANRNIKAAGIPALNDMLAVRVAGVTHIDFSDPFMGQRMQDARLAYWSSTAKGLASEIHVLEHVAGLYSAPYHQPGVERLSLLKVNLAKAQDEVQKLKAAKQADTVPTIADVRPHLDWPAVQMLNDWSCDGLLISVDDDVDIDDSNQPRVSRDDGILLNVAIQGPSPCRNTAWESSDQNREGHQYAPQHVDVNIAPLDKVFVGILSKPERNDAGELQRVGFEFKLFSGRQLAVSQMASSKPRSRIDSVQNGPTGGEFEALCGAWRVGSVLDNRLTTNVERMMSVNVCVEFWTLTRLWNTYIHEPASDAAADRERHETLFPALPPVVPP